MSWHEIFPRSTKPSFEQISSYIDNKIWQELNEYLQSTYTAKPKVEYSQCSAAPGWNVKYKKSGRSLCVLYPNKGFFTCLVCIGNKESLEAELLLPTCTEYTNNLYRNSSGMNGTRWLMINVTSSDVLADTKKLIATRVLRKK